MKDHLSANTSLWIKDAAKVFDLKYFIHTFGGL